MKREYSLTFSYKGQRDYVQGPDILDTVLELLLKDFHELRDVRYSAHNWIRNNADMVLQEEKFATSVDSLITFEARGNTYYAGIVDNKRPITNRQEYSEEVIQTKSVIHNEEICFENTVDYRFSEVIVSMNKWYLQRTTATKGKWILTKLEYDSTDAIRDYRGKEIAIRLLKNLDNKLTKSAVFVEGIRVGHIYFSLIH